MDSILRKCSRRIVESETLRYARLAAVLGVFFLVHVMPGTGTARGQGIQSSAGRVSMPGEMQCMGLIHERQLSREIYVSGTEEEGIQAFSTEGNLVYLSGSGLGAIRPGDMLRAVRAEGKLQDRWTWETVGFYYRDTGTIRVERVEGSVAVGTITRSCHVIAKGDLLIPVRETPDIRFTAQNSTRSTTVPPQGLSSSILLGQDDRRELAAGNFCFIGVGSRDGVKPGDRFTIYRAQPAFDPKDLIVTEWHGATSYKSPQTAKEKSEIIGELSARELPPQALGDLVVLETYEGTAIAKIIYSRREIHPGDFVVRR